MRIADHRLNRLVVLKAIRRHAPLSRSELPALTGLSAGLITQVTAKLAARGLLLETREDPPLRGRPRIRLSVNGGGATVLGVSMNARGCLNATFVDLTGNRLYEAETPLPRTASLVDLAQVVAATLEGMIADSPFATAPIDRIAVSLPAIVDSGSGMVLQVWTMPPGPVSFAQILADRLGQPVTIDNDMTCMARAEHWFGRACDLDTFGLVAVDQTIGSAVFRDGLPAEGIHSEFGHSKIDVDSAASACLCGARGCLIATASRYGMARAWSNVSLVPRAAISRIAPAITELLDHFDAGDARARAIVDRAGTHLGAAIAGRINADDPQAMLIVIPDARLRAVLEPQVRLTVAAHALPALLARTRLRIAAALPDWRQKGAAALALEKLFLDDDVSLVATSGAPAPILPSRPAAVAFAPDRDGRHATVDAGRSAAGAGRD